ncbi:TetR/AcrR family transcriptional regulator [Fulvivirga sp. M361]|uniref:TetR/AcrR family transcriptional regulator n=1 Tax=Fulvivirga sp. M361 TaxID=2594266 RepID=UPI00117A37CA|nr:TetR/AcrR family transcriptional regulator [Fulvivirga sp. M361]TRX59555.1 TetR/AcrR family transcriptional regulator [Fulvivirga sp. M361]
MKVGRRQQKSAQLRLKILSVATKLAGKKSFDQLYVETICEKVGVSKVTFFKYFPQKDDILLYYWRVWLFERAVECSIEPKQGLDGIYYLNEKLADTFVKHPGIILGLISYITRFDRPPAPIPLKALDRTLLHSKEEVEKIEILSLHQMLENFVLEAIFRKEITLSSDTKEISKVFLSIMYGSLVSGHLLQVDYVKLYLKRNMDMALNGLK